MKAIVFDFDGVVVDTESAWFRAVQDVWAEHGLTYDASRWSRIVGAVTEDDWATELAALVGADPAALRRRRRERYGELAATVEPLAGVDALVTAAEDAGLPVAIASNSPRSWVEAHLEQLGWRDRFAVLTTIDDVVAGKPAPDLYRLAVERLGVEPRETVAIEDSPPGVAAAVAAGLVCVAVPSPLTRSMDFEAAALVVPSLAGVTLEQLGALVAARS